MAVHAPPTHRGPATLWIVFSTLALAVIPLLPIVLFTFSVDDPASPLPESAGSVAIYAQQFDFLVGYLKSLAVLLITGIVGANLLALLSFPFALTALKRCSRKARQKNIYSLIYFVVGPILVVLSLIVLVVLYLVVINVVDAVTSNREAAQNTAMPFFIAIVVIPPFLDIARFAYLLFAGIRVYRTKPHHQEVEAS